MKTIFTLVLTLIFSFNANSQKNKVVFDINYAQISEYKLQGFLQRLSLVHFVNDRFGLVGSVFTGNARGKDVSSDFKKDYILLTKNNYQNVPSQFTNGSVNLYWDGLLNYKRISSGLLQEHGFSVGFAYKLLQSMKLKSTLYTAYSRSTVSMSHNDNIFEIEVTNFTVGLDKKMVYYPAPIILKYFNENILINADLTYQITEKIGLGCSGFIKGTDLKKLDLGLGLSLGLKI